MYKEGIKVVVLDLDYTLYNADIFFLSAWSEISKGIVCKFNLSKDYYSRINYSLKKNWILKGIRYRRMIDEALEEVGLAGSEYIHEALKIYHSNWNFNAILYDGVQEFFDWANSIGIKLCLFTEGNIQTQERKIRTLGITDLFDKIYFTTNKLASSVLSDILRQYQIGADELLYIGDDYCKDHLVAKSFGVESILLLSGNSQDDVNACNIEGICCYYNFKELFNAIEKDL